MLPEQEAQAQALKAYMAAQMPKRPRFRLGCLGQLFALILILIAVGVIYAALNPWAFFMGGNFHPLGYWHGWGQMHSKTAGDYLLYVTIYPNMHSRGTIIPSTPVKGNAYLCTPKGERFYLNLGGSMPFGYYVKSLGKSINLYMYNWRDTLPVGQDSRPSFKIYGHWGHAELIADDRKSLSAAFLPNGTLRPKGSHVLPSETEDMQLTLQEGSYSEFEAACRASRH